MALLRCPHPSHGDRPVPLRSNNDRVFECEESHRFYRRGDAGDLLLVDLISGRPYRPESLEGDEAVSQPALNFMVDVPRIVGTLDFDRLTLSAAEWKIISKIDGRSTVEEVRLLAGMKAEDAERVLLGLIEAGLVDLRGRR